MKDLSICQEYFLCVLNEKGKLPALRTEIPVCILAGGLLDLIFAKSVEIGEDKKLRITGELSSENQHLDSLYTYIKNSKPMKVDKLASEYTFTFTDKRMRALTEGVGKSLVRLGYASAENGGLFGNTLCFVPDKKCVDNVIQKIRAELLEDGIVSDDTIALVSLMDKSYQIKRYFSVYEKDRLKARIKEIQGTDSNKLVKEMIDYIEALIAVFIAATAVH